MRPVGGRERPATRGRTAVALGILCLLATGLLGAGGCGGSGGGGEPTPAPVPVDTPKPDFALTDVNPGSATHQTVVSPRQHLGRVSAWYFGHAT